MTKVLAPKQENIGKFLTRTKHPKPARIARTLRTIEEVDLALPIIAKYILAPKESDLYAVRFNRGTGEPEKTVSHAVPSPRKPLCVPAPDSPVSSEIKVHRKVAEVLFSLVRTDSRVVLSTGEHEMVLEPWYENMNYGHTIGAPEMRLVGTKVHVADWMHVDILPNLIESMKDKEKA